jgi:hypothetical protein
MTSEYTYSYTTEAAQPALIDHPGRGGEGVPRGALMRFSFPIQPRRIFHNGGAHLKDARDFGLLPPGSSHLDDLGTLSGFWDREKREAAHDALQDARCCAAGLRWLSTLSVQPPSRPPALIPFPRPHPEAGTTQTHPPAPHP